VNRQGYIVETDAPRVWFNAISLKRQGDGWVVEVPDSPKPAETFPPEGEIPWDGGDPMDPSEKPPFWLDLLKLLLADKHQHLSM